MSLQQEFQAVLLNSEEDPNQVVKEAMHAIVEFAVSELDMSQEDLMAELETAMADEG